MKVFTRCLDHVKRFFRDPFHRGMSLLFVLHVTTVSVLTVMAVKDYRITPEALDTRELGIFMLGMAFGAAFMLPLLIREMVWSIGRGKNG